MNPKVLIIIINWNGWLDTIECLESLYQNTYNNYDIIVVDNNSEDDSISKIRDYCAGDIKVKSKFLKYNPQIKPVEIFEYAQKALEQAGYKDRAISTHKKLILLKNSENYGFTEGNNVAIRFALRNLNPDYILFLNNDCVVGEEFLEQLVFHHRDETFALSQAKILSYHSPEIIDSTGGMADIFGAGASRGHGEIDKGQYDNFQKEGFFYTLGTCMLVSSRFLLESNGDEFFDRLIFAVHEDFDICWQARLLGYDIVYCPHIRCYHKGHQSFKKKASLTVNALLLRNKLRILIKNYSLPYLFLFLPAAVIIDLVTSLMTAMAYQNIQYLSIFLQALMWNIKNMDDTLQKRGDIQSKRRIDDSKLVKSMKNDSIMFTQIARRIRGL